MAAVPIYVWNGSAWQETGPTIPANPIKYQTTAPSSPSTGDIWVDSDGDVTTGSQQFQRFRFVASGGETTISGADANGAVLAYTAGLEQVVLNGAVLVRGSDYTATTGTTITGLSPALVASDVLEVFSFIAFTVANTYTQSQVDGLLNSYVGLRLITPTSADNGTVGATGAVTFSGVSSVSLNGVFSSAYDNYKVILDGTVFSASCNVSFKFRTAGSDLTNTYYGGWTGTNHSGTVVTWGINNGASAKLIEEVALTKRACFVDMSVNGPYLTSTKNATWISQGVHTSTSTGLGGAGAVSYDTTGSASDGITFLVSSGTFSGSVRVYGYKN
jgi:hypothetical protein